MDGEKRACSLSPTDKAEGNKFSKDFEEGSSKLQEFVTFLEDQVKSGPSLQDALGNADIFYEMQYKEVKIVANVSPLLDFLKFIYYFVNGSLLEKKGNGKKIP